MHQVPLLGSVLALRSWAHLLEMASANFIMFLFLGVILLDIDAIGGGTGIVISTGARTEFGAIFAMMQDVEEKRTPLEASMDERAHKLSILSFDVIGVICLIGVLQKRGWLEMFTIGGV